MQRNTTFDELAQATPRRISGAPGRSRSHYEAILELLRERGPQGVLGSEFYSRPDLYGRSPRNRISELRKQGFEIENRTEVIDEVRHSWFRLVPAPKAEPPEPTSEDRPSLAFRFSIRRCGREQAKSPLAAILPG